eukprot:XP_020402668.1 basic proline-rich protein-like [Zea mays]
MPKHPSRGLLPPSSFPPARPTPSWAGWRAACPTPSPSRSLRPAGWRGPARPRGPPDAPLPRSTPWRCPSALARSLGRQRRHANGLPSPPLPGGARARVYPAHPGRPLFISLLPPTSPSTFSLLPIALAARDRRPRASTPFVRAASSSALSLPISLPFPVAPPSSSPAPARHVRGPVRSPPVPASPPRTVARPGARGLAPPPGSARSPNPGAAARDATFPARRAPPPLPLSGAWPAATALAVPARGPVPAPPGELPCQRPWRPGLGGLRGTPAPTSPHSGRGVPAPRGAAPFARPRPQPGLGVLPRPCAARPRPGVTSARAAVVPLRTYTCVVKKKKGRHVVVALNESNEQETDVCVEI